MKIMKMYTQDQLDQVVDAFQAHKVLALPTDTVYGVGVLYGDLADLDHLKHAKHRPETKPIPMMVSNLEQMKQIAKVDARTEKLVQTFLPGPLTLVLPVSETLDLAYTNGKKTVAVRIPDEPFVLAVIEKLGKPLLVSSANVSGKPAAVSYQEAMDNLPNIDGIIQGECKQLEASTIVDCTQDKLSILRPGPILLKELTNCL
jgi:L-threonylcarbamoyladenylate synthase